MKGAKVSRNSDADKQEELAIKQRAVGTPGPAPLPPPGMVNYTWPKKMVSDVKDLCYILVALIAVYAYGLNLQAQAAAGGEEEHAHGGGHA